MKCFSTLVSALTMAKTTHPQAASTFLQRCLIEAQQKDHSARALIQCHPEKL